MKVGGGTPVAEQDREIESVTTTSLSPGELTITGGTRKKLIEKIHKFIHNTAGLVAY